MEVDTASNTTLDSVVEKYITLRDRKAELKKEFERNTESIDAGLAKCEMFFLAQMQKMGLESLPTRHGVPYKTTRTSATVADPEIFRQWVIANQAWPALDVKANKTFVAAFKEEHQDLPPGINWREEITVNVRRK
jgi:hypothetical protein